jgi:thiaminase
MPFHLTQHLLSITPSSFKAATQAPFLHAAATGSLPSRLSQQWLCQDRLYALNYLTFISQLLSKLRIPTHSQRTSTLNWRIADTLIECLIAIRKEISLFEDVASQEDWSSILDTTRPSKITLAYADLFAGAGQPSASLLNGMTVLWATEKCYLEAWRWARGLMADDVEQRKDVMGRLFIPNWSSDEFAGFVEGLGDLVDELGKDAEEEDVRDAEEVWKQVLWVEERFWPDVSGDKKSG